MLDGVPSIARMIDRISNDTLDVHTYGAGRCTTRAFLQVLRAHSHTHNVCILFSCDIANLVLQSNPAILRIEWLCARGCWDLPAVLMASVSGLLDDDGGGGAAVGFITPPAEVRLWKQRTDCAFTRSPTHNARETAARKFIQPSVRASSMDLWMVARW